eukprot:2246310-Rhodomonas_salina.1
MYFRSPSNTVCGKWKDSIQGEIHFRKETRSRSAKQLEPRSRKFNIDAPPFLAKANAHNTTLCLIADHRCEQEPAAGHSATFLRRMTSMRISSSTAKHKTSSWVCRAATAVKSLLSSPMIEKSSLLPGQAMLQGKVPWCCQDTWSRKCPQDRVCPNHHPITKPSNMHLSEFEDLAITETKSPKPDITDLKTVRAMKKHLLGKLDIRSVRGLRLFEEQEELWSIFLDRTSNGFVKLTRPPPTPRQIAPTTSNSSDGSNDSDDSDGDG